MKTFEFQIKLKVIWSSLSNWQLVCIGWDNDFVMNRQQAIITTNGNPIHWCIYASLSLNELILSTATDAHLL